MVHGCMMYTERAEMSAVFMWHQPCQRCKYTTSVDIQKTKQKQKQQQQNKTKQKRYKKLFTHV